MNKSMREATLQVCHQDILAIENHYQDIKAEQSKLDVLIHHDRSFK